ncbi:MULTISPECIES: enoyl-CoA hydratase [Cupriavidus]|uniref:enoyl-CoA hydratase n=1 Tax=Cupriavidus TaxID=106589 RepID=UPI000A9350AD|nr:MULTISPECIES: enoyl-CoA hydratase [Cupriavidus]
MRAPAGAGLRAPANGGTPSRMPASVFGEAGIVTQTHSTDPGQHSEAASVLVEIDPAGYAVLTLNRPQAMNALSVALCRALAEAVAALRDDPRVRVLILTGSGRAFCAGLDLKELAAGRELSAFVSTSDPVRVLGTFRGPVIGAINGAAITGGFELALACDMLIASTEARFADTHARVGIVPGWGLSQKLSRLVGLARAKEISLTGNFVGAQEAERIGLVNRVVAPETLLPAARRLAEDLLSAVPEMLPEMKQLIDEGYALPLGEALALERRRSSAWSQAMPREEIARRREAVQQRGRAQAAGG